LRGIYYFHNNASGQPEEVSDRDGKIVWRGRYNAWGQLLYEEAPQGFVQNLRMQGQYCDRETGLHYNTFRYYDSDIGRFTTEDPIGLLGGVNLYQYAPNPLSWIDPWGWENCGGGKPNHGAGKSTKKYGHARNRHGSQRAAQELKDRARASDVPQGHFSDNAMIEEAFANSPKPSTTAAGNQTSDVVVSKPSNVYYPDGTTTTTNNVRVVFGPDGTPKTGSSLF
jgi:RHS repeat-associated protein